jgi:hypothetical protein
MPALIVIALRIVLPLTNLRWPLAGGLLALVIDATDVVLVDGIASLLGQPPEFGPIYAQLDNGSTCSTWGSRFWSPGGGRRRCRGAPHTSSSRGGSSA